MQKPHTGDVILRKNKRYIYYTWIVLICFIAGQTMVYAHRHNTRFLVQTTNKTSQSHQTITEKCQLCDAMHHDSMMPVNHQYVTPVLVADHVYQQGEYDFVSIGLILSPGRAPPLS